MVGAAAGSSRSSRVRAGQRPGAELVLARATGFREGSRGRPCGAEPVRSRTCDVGGRVLRP